MDKTQLFGRRVPLTQAPPEATGKPALQLVNGHWQCQRCHQWVAPQDCLPHGVPYCRHCLNLGRLTKHTKLYTIPEPNQFLKWSDSPLSWAGTLSEQQHQAALAVCRLVQAQRDQLLWAVTGAGKTEMVYPALAWALQRGWRVAWTSPRVDVCLELAPRLAQAFAAVPQTVLYGGQPAPYRYCQLTICTTHQLLRFEAAFDWIVVDEVDAFPLATSPMLQRAIVQAQKPAGCHLYLTATPGPDLQRKLKRHQLAVTYLPLRYHGHLLPPLRTKLVGAWRTRLVRHGLPPKVLRQLRAYAQTGQRYLFFVPRVSDLRLVARALRQAGLPEGVTVHAADPDRQAKVQAFRDGQGQCLITTTILERGVTFPAVFVVILGGDDPVFSTAALVQIAGRVGRHRDYPTGDVWCYCQSLTREIYHAQHMIHELNRRGKRLGGRS